ncbi:MAG: hypothetical protein Q4D38_15105, partial [Planctomycetia bacterium]|nr:hypothetical protein [Planctomycetia bacterium]
MNNTRLFVKRVAILALLFIYCVNNVFAESGLDIFQAVDDRVRVLECPSDETLKKFAEDPKNSKIQHVIIHSGFRVSDVGLESLAKMNIVSLSMDRAPSWSARLGKEEMFSGVAFKKFTSLRYLGIAVDSFSDEGVAAIAQIPTLETLVMEDAGITQEQFALLMTMKQLRSFTLHEQGFNDEWITSQNLENLSSLEVLDLEGGSIREGVFEAVSRLPNLKSLRLKTGLAPRTLFDIPFINPEIVDKITKECSWNWAVVTRHMRNLEHLESLSLDGCIVAPEQWEFPPNFTRLKRLTIIDVNAAPLLSNSDKNSCSDALFLEAYEHIPNLEYLEGFISGEILTKFLERNPTMELGALAGRELGYVLSDAWDAAHDYEDAADGEGYAE